MRPEKVWRAALGELQLQVSRSTFDTWLRDARLVSCEESEYIIGVDSGFARDWLDAHMRNTVGRTVGGIGGGAATVSFVVWPQDPATTSGETPLFPAAPDKEVSRQTRAPAPRQSFDDFVVGTGNRMANAFTMFLTVIAYQFVLANTLPELPYLTVLDTHMLTSMAFIIAVIFEVALLCVHSRRADTDRERLEEMNDFLLQWNVSTWGVIQLAYALCCLSYHSCCKGSVFFRRRARALPAVGLLAPLAGLLLW